MRAYPHELLMSMTLYPTVFPPSRQVLNTVWFSYNVMLIVPKPKTNDYPL